TMPDIFERTLDGLRLKRRGGSADKRMAAARACGARSVGALFLHIGAVVVRTVRLTSGAQNFKRLSPPSLHWMQRFCYVDAQVPARGSIPTESMTACWRCFCWGGTRATGLGVVRLGRDGSTA